MMTGFIIDFINEAIQSISVKPLKKTPTRWPTAAGVVLLCAAGTAFGNGGEDFELLVRDQHGRAVADAILSLHAPQLPRSAHRPGQPRPVVVIDQIDKRFVPELTAIQVGTAVSFPNRDQTRHHVYSFSKPNPFEIKLYSGTPVRLINFDIPGLVSLGCNIHDRMRGAVYVVDSPYFAVTDDDGRARLVGVPAGDYRLRQWHARLEPQRGRDRPLAVGPGGERIELELSLLPPPPPRELTPLEKKFRRQSSAGS